MAMNISQRIRFSVVSFWPPLIQFASARFMAQRKPVLCVRAGRVVRCELARRLKLKVGVECAAANTMHRHLADDRPVVPIRDRILGVRPFPNVSTSCKTWLGAAPFGNADAGTVPPIRDPRCCNAFCSSRHPTGNGTFRLVELCRCHDAAICHSASFGRCCPIKGNTPGPRTN